MEQPMMVEPTTSDAECCYFKLGTCKFGRNCRFQHTWTSSLCQFGPQCRYGHPEKPPMPIAQSGSQVGRSSAPGQDRSQSQSKPKRTKLKGGVPPHTLPELPAIPRQKFDYFLVLDLEGKAEILEFPVVLVDASTLEIIDTFHRYIHPIKLSQEHIHSYVTRKYGQWGLDKVWFETAIPFTTALKEFDQWREQHHCTENAAFVTCGDWDIKTQIPHQCGISEIEVPSWADQWINLKKVFMDFYQKEARGMARMLNLLRIPLEGNHHSGLDDAKNITKVLQQIIRHGCVVDITGHRITSTGNPTDLGEGKP